MRDVSAAAATGVRAADTAIASIRAHLDRGAPWDACDAFREVIGAAPDNCELVYWGALAHARTGATHEAHALLDRAQPGAEQAGAIALLVEILSLRGRLFKDALHRAPGRRDAARLAELAREQYLAAYRLRRDPYPGVNAATLSLLLGDRATAATLASEVSTTLASPASVWDRASLAEARLVLGDVAAARHSYANAHRDAAGNGGMIASMRRQLMLLASAVPAATDCLAELPAASVIAFAGHMVDAPGRDPPRFPLELVPPVAAALRERLAALHDPIVFASAACGADLLFLEAAAERGAEVNVVMPFDRDDFVRTSVAVGGSEWPARFEAALAKAHRVIMTTDERYLGDDVLFEHAARLAEGFARLRADQLQTTASLLCVVEARDGSDPGRIGGTQATLARWNRDIGAADVIELREMRAQLPGGGATSQPPTDAPADRGPTGIATASHRTLKTMLFADFAGYSRLRDAIIPQFQREFLEIAAALIESASVRPLEAKTWGDALYAVLDDARDGAEFALRFAERMRAVDWSKAGLADAGQVRVALHAGAVYRCFDPVMGRDSYFGSNVTRAARIEPVTPPGAVYASEAFAATLAATGRHDYALEYVGQLALAKGYGESRIYRLDRR